MEDNFEFIMKVILVGLMSMLFIFVLYGFSFWIRNQEYVSNYEKIMSGDLSGCKHYSLQHAPLPCVKELYAK